MGTTIFIALQCCQCSTMQVKQQKKSSNKWSCVVCNQKQSVQKVFAQGYMAKDLRLFVQSVNMSRKSAEENQNLFDDEDGNDDDQVLPAANQRKRRTDWTEYLDPQNLHEKLISDEQQKDGGDFEPKIVTELPKEMFKRPKLNNYTSREGDDNLYKPDFSQRNSKNKVRKEPMTFKPIISKGASKWNDYITQDEDDLQLGTRTNFTDHMSEWSNAVLENDTNDQRVEEDIHPDFI